MPAQGRLFRREVLAAQRQSALGSIHLATPLAHWLISGFVALFAISLVAFLYFGHYTRRATVTGELVPNAGLITLSATTQGMVSRILVHQGERVKRGQSLLEFNHPLDSTALGNIRAIITTQLQAQRSGLKADLLTQKQLSASQTRALRDRIASLAAQQVQIAEQRTLQQRQARRVQALLARVESLANKGYVSTLQLQQQQAKALNAQLQVKALQRQQLDTTSNGLLPASS